ncbi:MAG: hypothetical protein HY834_02260 [Devosia nanyangense]|uniref:Uncharacterized protein n=1 Tax=Devosia nanyangense TaxID=1228055 RepID=A0A933L0X7_9HYPH|nr:hypothetical protein [Devosia nanyangense]
MTLIMNTSAPSRRWLRSTGAVLAGFVTVFALSSAVDAVLHAVNYYPNDGTPGSDLQLAVALAYRTAITVLGGWVAARLAPANAMRHAVILGILGTLAGVVGVVAAWSIGHHWYAISLAALALPSTALGGWLFTRASR